MAITLEMVMRIMSLEREIPKMKSEMMKKIMDIRIERA